MLLKDVIQYLQISGTTGDLNIEVLGVAYDSRQVKPGDVFVAVPGFKVDGAKFAAAAVQNGAVAVICQNPVAEAKVPQIVVPNARAALAMLSNRFYDFPSRKLKVIGVTGTNGKTTICYLLDHILRASGYKVGMITTVEVKVDGKSTESKMTTPESVDLQRLFADMLNDGVTHVVMEVSSHSLALDRVLGVEFDVAVFTNLTHDHLDFHKTMDEYFAAKLKLFQAILNGSKKDAVVVTNIDDGYGKKIMDIAKHRALSYSTKTKADLSAKDEKFSLTGTSFSIASGTDTLKASSKLIGAANVYNILASMLCAFSMDVDIDDCLKAIESFPGAPGRFESIHAGQQFPVIVDFAHSPDSLEKLIQTYRPLIKGKIILVFGCPGDRDKEKRPIMGELAVKLADHVIISTDDPHSESPEAIVNEIEAGIKGRGKEPPLCLPLAKGERDEKRYEKIIDRRAAIKRALELAKKDDIVLIAGRGHEKYQDFNGKKVEIDDREIVKELLTS